MDILENELVRRYFCRCEKNPCECEHGLLSYWVLRAMQEPIKKGDSYLYKRDGKWGVETALYDFGVDFNTLRLPSKFQTAGKKNCESRMVKCEQCGYEASIHMPKQGETVTVKLSKDIASESEMGRPMEKECKELRKAICGCTYCLDAYCKKHGCFHIKSYVDSAKEEFLEKKFKRIEGQFTWFKNEFRSLLKLAREGKADGK